MGKFKEKIVSIFSYIKWMFENRKVSMILICVATGLFTLSSIWDIFYYESSISYASFEPFENFLIQTGVVLALYILSVFWIETIKNKIGIALRVILYVFGGLLSIFFTGIRYGSESSVFSREFKTIRDIMGNTRVVMYIFAYVVILILLNLYANFKRTIGMSFSTYCFRVFSRTFLAGVVYGVLCFGSLMLTLIFTTLLWGDLDEILFPIIIVITGMYFGASVFHAVGSAGDDVSTFMEVVIRYVMFFMCAAAYLIIYVYMLKIVITWNFPSNSVFLILTALFTVSMPIAYMSLNQKNDFVHKLANLMPVLFAPFIVLQAMSMGMRIVQHGFTPSRCMAIFFILFETIYVIWHVVSRGRIEGMLIVLAIFAVVSVYLPGTNVLSVSKNMGYLSIRTALNKDYTKFSENRFSRLSSAVDYLMELDDDSDFMERHFSEEQRNWIAEAINYNSGEVKKRGQIKEYLNYRTSVMELNISGYSTMEAFVISKDQEMDEESGRYIGIDYSNVEVKLAPLDNGYHNPSDEKTGLSLDCTRMVERSLDAYPEDLSDMSNEFIISEDWLPNGESDSEYIDGKIFLTAADILIDENTMEVLEIYFEGYILKK